MNQKRNILSAIVGNALEYYDVMLYGFFTALLAPLFFPSHDPFISHLSAVGAFAISFLMRPIGGIIFGYIGDRYGRKKAFIPSIIFATIPTVMIGFLPTYDQIGVFAPILLVLCRMIQGVCVAGEYTGAALLIAEFSKKKNATFLCSFLPASSFVGIVVATAFGAIATLPSMPHWAWRVPFMLSAFIGFFAYYLRRNVEESQVFKNFEKEKKLERFPLLTVLKKDTHNFLCSVGISVSNIGFFYVVMSYITGLAVNAIGDVSPHAMMKMSTLLFFVWGIFLLTMGYVGSRLGPVRVMKFSALAIVVLAIPLFLFLKEETSLPRIMTAILTITVFGSGFVAPGVALLATGLFPVKDRFTGVAVGGALGSSIAGFATSMIMPILLKISDTGIGPGIYLMVCSLIGWISVSLVHHLKDGAE